MYNTDSLKAGIEQCKNNIKTFEEAIAREYVTISEYRRMIFVLEEKEATAKKAQANIHVEVEAEDE